MEFVEFTGDENEIEFIEKCVKQWELTASSSAPDAIKFMQLGTVFTEMEHRLENIKCN